MEGGGASRGPFGPFIDQPTQTREQRDRWWLASLRVAELPDDMPKLTEVIEVMEGVIALSDEEVATEMMIRELGKE